MNYFLAVVSCAALVLLAGCGEDNQPPEPYASRSTDGLAMDNNGDVLAVVNSVGTTGHVAPYEPLDDQPIPPDYSAVLWRYDENGQRQDYRDFWNGWSSEFTMQYVAGVRPMSDGNIVVIGMGGRGVSAVVDSGFRYQRAQYWGNWYYIYSYASSPAGSGLAWLFDTGNDIVLAFLSGDGALVSESTIENASFGSKKLVGISDSQAVIITGESVSEYVAFSSVPVWTVPTPLSHFDSGGLDHNGNLILFGVMEQDSLPNQLAVATRVADTLQYQTCNIESSGIDEVSSAVHIAEAVWLLACRSYPDKKFSLLRYDGSDTVRVVNTWIPEGEPRTVCAAKSSSRVAFGGNIDYRGDYRQDAFIRTYSLEGSPLWSDVLVGE